MPTTISACKCARLTGIPVEDWPGRCHEIADAILKTGIVKGYSRYGFYYGPIAAGSLFSDSPATRHGWIARPRGGIIDPTRWVFEACQPYIFMCGAKDERVEQYDTGGAKLRELYRAHLPPAHTGTSYAGPRVIFHSAVHPYLDRFFGRRDLCCEQLRWLANCSPAFLSPVARFVYKAFIDADKGVWVPIDFQQEVFNDQY